MQSNPLILFLQEIFKRMAAKSPRFFIIWQWIFGAVTAVSGIPTFLVGVGVHLTGLLANLQNQTLAICAAIGLIMSMMPTQGTTVAVDQTGAAVKQTDQDKLPFTAKTENEKAIINKVTTTIPVKK